MNYPQKIAAWLKSYSGLGDADYWFGAFQENPSNKVKRVGAISQQGGSSNPLVDYPIFRITILGPENTPEDAVDLYSATNEIRVSLRDNYSFCGTAQVRLMGVPVGPVLTAEKRVWFEFNVQLII